MTTSTASLTDAAIDLANEWVETTAAGETAKEKRTTGRLAALVSDPAGLELAVRFVDRVARPQDIGVAAHELVRLAQYTGAAGSFLGPIDRALLTAGTVAAPLAPRVVVPAARIRLRQLVGHLVADAGKGLTKHIAQAKDEGFRLNLNLLGEAVLGEGEAASRLARVHALIERPDVDYVSIKVSAVASQLSTWDTAGSRDRVVAKLRPLYHAAKANGTFLNLDMEEYKDLALTVRVFEQILVDPELRDLEVGIVLQAYLPDALGALDEITEMAKRRTAIGGARVKVRLVKGANLAMEKVESELHGWVQAPYGSKPEVDANYVRLVERALRPERAAHVRIGVASHNLFHVALAHLLATERGVTEALDIEMLQGMAPAQARAVRDVVGRVLLYTPVVAREDFDVAISYLIRRLEENAAEQNFLHSLFAGKAPDPVERLAGQREAFLASVRDAELPSTEPRRQAREATPGDVGPAFENSADTDAAVEESRRWAADLIDRKVPTPAIPVLHTVEDVDAAVARASAVLPGWAGTKPHDRAEVLRRAAVYLEEARGDLVATMIQEPGKTITEADPEVSEAVDFARYYADSAERLADGAIPGARFTPEGLTVVTPPWNFPVAIPVGAMLSALAAGSPVLVKPSHATPRCVAVSVAAIHRAMDDFAVPRDVLQVVRAGAREAGRRLVAHPGVARVLLTGSIETAELFASWRTDLDVIAETSGKNALIVTPSADIDLAVADAVRSAFGHAGQKCSAASLLILVGSAGRSDRLRRQLADAVASLRVGPARDLATTVGPLTEPASGKLLRALSTLEPGEEWLVEPRRLDETGYLWTPGVKHGVAPGSFFHLTECFGPVLGVMRVDTLDEAIDAQNAVAFGLTGGIHSLDEDEIETWLERVEVGNAYVNRHITGAIVRRQPFGGWKASSVGPGAKAGGPNYVAELGSWTDGPEVPSGDTPADDAAWLAWAEADDARWWASEFGATHDPSGLRVEENAFRYRPIPHLTVRVGADAREREVTRVVATAHRAGVPVTVSRFADTSDEEFAAHVRDGVVAGRIRVVGSAPGLREASRSRIGSVTVLDFPIVASGRRELLTVVREQAISRTLHRFGHLG
ncbi:bifunctional proline dehydrogenase/L-glutamate gamma-semialdehyde dehydrogenase [Pengzhenrongella sp.]|jgi:RHH-type proline utilization regulon transcriptional repressor/proline dehydrogenase/delta 1-pyrroline-5-carboxylate dehydrogenase|uniref:bifunctional proline dehydrogenase/L-glutamate gamma-semialdehyde dehydrogenase n=1 Tax=Pengzhenrongella sp. TaxID=2888820 RepID=UPI002F95319D